MTVRKRSLNWLLAAAASIVLIITAGRLVTAQSPFPRPSAAASLKEKTDVELLEFVAGRRDPADRYVSEVNDDERARPSLLDRLWEMSPQSAALALVTDYVNARDGPIIFEIDDPNAKPPPAGEIGLRWINGNEYAAPAEGVTILKYDGYDSKLLLSEVEIVGQPSKGEIEKAVMKTDEHRLYRAVAQQTFEILWWLRHVRFKTEPTSYTGATFSSVDDFGRFWMKPDGPSIDRASFGEPCGQCINGNKDPEAYAGFADTLIRRVIQRSGIKHRYPVPTVGTFVDPDDDSKFLQTTPPPLAEDLDRRKQYVERLVKILNNPQRAYLNDSVMEMLVPIGDPLRYNDQRIDGALLAVLHRGLEAKAKLKSLPELQPLDSSKYPDPVAAEKQRKSEEDHRKKRRIEERDLNDLWFAGSRAADKLGMHDSLDAFPELFQLGKDKTISLVPAASIAGRHPELRPQLVEYLKNNISVEEVWRADLRDLSNEMETLASSAPTRGATKIRDFEEIPHKAAVILSTWKEPDPLTKTKLDVLLTGYVGNATSVPEVLRVEFAALSKEDQLKVRNLVTWMRTVDVPWSRRYIENAFTPHTPRPDISFER